MNIKAIWIRYHLKTYKFFLKIIGFSKDKTSRNLFRLFQIAIYAIVIVFFITLVSTGKSSFGEWGDFFGGMLNPILSFLTFMGLLITIVLQQRELRESRKEFHDSKIALIEQSKTQQLQQFENTFFNLLKKFNYKVDKDSNGESDHSNDRFKRFEIIRYKLYEYHEYYFKDDKDTTSVYSYGGLYRDSTYQLDEYFRNLFFMIDFILNSDLIKSKKRIYLKILFNDLTYNEIFFIFYHIVSEKEWHSYKSIMEEYELFDRLSHKSFIHPCIDILRYEKSVYGNNKSMILTYNHCQKELRKI